MVRIQPTSVFYFILLWVGIYFKNHNLINKNFFFINLHRSKISFFIKYKKPNFNFNNSFNNFFLAVTKNNLFIFNNFFFFKIIYNQLNAFSFFIFSNYKFFFFNVSKYNLNLNLLNLSFLNFGTVNKNFIFFFFKLNWLKYDANQKKFSSFIYDSNINFLFFFKPVNMLNFMFFFNNLNVILGGIPNTSGKNLHFDYPLFLNNSNLFHIFFSYKFFINLVCEKNKFINLNIINLNLFFFNLFFLGSK